MRSLLGVICLSSWICFGCKHNENTSSSAKAEAIDQGEKNDLKVEYSIEIKASAKKVWDVVADFANYGKWNEWTNRLDGKPELGAIVKA